MSQMNLLLVHLQRNQELGRLLFVWLVLAAEPLYAIMSYPKVKQHSGK
jgi:hypothetical protein